MSAARPTPFTAAPELVRKGYRVFACRERSKKPATEHGFKDSTDDVGLAEGIAEAHPTRNIGIDCGASGINAFDIDSKHGADPEEVISELGLTDADLVCVIETGPAPPPGGEHPNSLEGVRGRQVWFRGDLPTQDLSIPGTEIRGVGGYAMAPPSIHPSGVPYAGEVPPVSGLPVLPDSIRAAAQVKEQSARKGPLPPLLDRIPAGRRRKTFHDYALSLRRKGFSYEGIAAALKAENHRCGADPDKPEPLPDDVIEEIARDKTRRFEEAAPPENDRTHRTDPANPHEQRDSVFGRVPNTHRTPTEHPPDLARDPELLARHDALVGSMGLVGERHLSRLAFLTHISRLLDSPGRLVVKGDSSTGKSEAVRCGLAAAAPEELWVRSQTSALALFYTEDDLRHKTLVFYEATKLGEDDDSLAQVLRTLISEGELRYEVTVPEKRATQLLEKEGPVAFVSTTTKPSLDREIETRILSAHSNNSDEQTVAVVKSILLAEGEGSDPVADLAPWHELDRWLRGAPRGVVAPWARTLASFDLSGPPRLRRDVTNLLSLAKAHALLHRGMREVDERGRIVSTPADYEVVCELLASALAIATDRAVREGTRKIVEAVKVLRSEESTRAVSLRAAAAKAGRAYSTTSTDVHDALDRGYLVNRSARLNAHDLHVGDPLPESSELLPTPEQLEERFQEQERSVDVRSVFGRGPNTESQSQSQISGGVRSVRSNPGGAGEEDDAEPAPPDPAMQEYARLQDETRKRLASAEEDKIARARAQFGDYRDAVEKDLGPVIESTAIALPEDDGP